MSGPVYKVPPQSRASIRALANTVRRSLGITDLHFPIMEVLEFGLPRLDKDYVFEVSSVQEMGSNHGLTIPIEKRIVLREDVYERALEGSGRDRMTAAHEFGHLLLHTQVALARADSKESVKPYESSEWQANCYGGELLVPATHANALLGMSLDAIAKHCGVSLEAAEYQMREISKAYKN